MDTIAYYSFIRIAFFFVFITAEYAISRYKKLDNFDLKELQSSMFMIILFESLPIIFSPKIDSYLMMTWKERLFTFPPRTLWVTALAFIAVDFMYYWTHRYNHATALGWTSHFMHHSPTRYNISVGYRLGITRFYSFTWLAFFPLVYLGFHPALISFCYLLSFCWQVASHTELVGTLGVLDKFLTTPSNHRVHHSSDPRFYNSNFGGVFIIFDRMFGTYRAESEMPDKKYGIESYMQKNYFDQIFYFWKVVIKSFWYEKNIFKKIFILFRRPENIKNY